MSEDTARVPDPEPPAPLPRRSAAATDGATDGASAAASDRELRPRQPHGDSAGALRASTARGAKSSESRPRPGPERFPVEPGAFDGRSILITGGTGSLGQALTREILAWHEPKRLVIFSRDEQKQYSMAQLYKPEEHASLRYFIGDVRDLARLKRAMNGVDLVVHAAAMKHVPIAEYNPFECIRTNVQGAENVITAAIEEGVERVMALSTDKAANPINLYGATKLAADKCFVAANHLAGEKGARFSVVRYGNVWGSRGSVVELYQKLVARGARRLPVTDARMTRFWITLPEGVAFVLNRLTAMRGGELFVPKLPSMRVVDLARSLAPDAELQPIGIRPGEKLHEVLLPEPEARNTLEYEHHYTVQPAFNWWDPDKGGEERGVRGKAVGDGFEYASDTNVDWLSVADLGCMLGTEETCEQRASLARAS